VSTYEETLVNISLDAHADLVSADSSAPFREGVNPNGLQYRFVQVSGDHECNIFTGAVGTVPLGVLQNKPQEEAHACTVAIHGISMVEAGGAITAGDLVGVDGDGRAISGGALGIAIYGAPAPNAGESGPLIPVLLRLTATSA
jgi:hypothetical protein